MSYIVIFIILGILFSLFIPIVIYVLPVVLLFVVVIALISTFTGGKNKNSNNSNTHYYSSNHSLPRRQARPDSIDAEFTETRVTDDDGSADSE